MSTPRGTRRRAVRLTPEAIDLVQRALIERWQATGAKGKLTRQRKAELLGLSVVTSDRVLRGEGVDRPTLTLAFRNLGLTWAEELCSLSSEVPPTEAANGPIAPETLNPPPPSHPTSSPARLWPIAVGAIVMLAMMMGTNVRGNNSDNFNLLVHLSERAYHRADYVTSRTYMRQALDLARKQERVPTLSEALRLAGDLERVTGDFAAARQHYFDAYRLRSSLSGSRNLASLLTYLGETETELGMYADASAHLADALQRFEQAADSGGVVMVRRALGELAYDQGQHQQAGEQFELALSSVQDEAMRVDLRSLNALVQARRGQIQFARHQLARSYEFWSERSHARWLAKTQLRQAEVELLAGNQGDALRLLTSSLAMYSQIGDRAGVEACRRLETSVDELQLTSRSNVNSR